MLLRPYGIVVDGQLELGVEVEIQDGKIVTVRPHTGIPDDYVLSPAFVNAHSHLEYRGLLGQIPTNLGYWDWIRALTKAKFGQDLDAVRDDCRVAARENRTTGVALIGEHSDRPFAGRALSEVGIGGVIFQEVITLMEHATRLEKLALVEERALLNRAAFEGLVTISPHAYYTVDRATLGAIGASNLPFSIHVAETALESAFTREGTGPIGDMYRANDIPIEITGVSVVRSLAALGLLRPGAQYVHCCALEPDEPALLAEHGVTVAHCPRSNLALGCPGAPIRELLDHGVVVGLGLDSPASSGPIDMFAEMRAASAIAAHRGGPLSGQEVWRMATSQGKKSIPGISDAVPDWDLILGSSVPLIAIELPFAQSIDDLIESGSPDLIRWIE